MDIKELILTDAGVDAIEKGAWVGDLPGAPGVNLKVIGTASKAYRKAIQAKMEAARKKQDGKPLTADQVTVLVREVFGEVALLDWKGLTSEGKELPFDRELAKKWLTSRNGDAFSDLVATAAQRLDASANQYAEQATKN